MEAWPRLRILGHQEEVPLCHPWDLRPWTNHVAPSRPSCLLFKTGLSGQRFRGSL